MIKQLFKTMAAVLAIAAAAAGPVRGQNASPDVTLDFTTNDWGIPEGKANKAYDANSYTSGDYTITLQGGGGSSNGYYFNSGYLMLGKSGAYLELPEFSSPVEKIEVVGNSAASGQVTQNIYVGATAVSTQTTGATGTNTYVINENYRAAGNIYTLKVESAQNTQITYIKVYYVSSGGGSTPEPPAPPVPHNVRFAEGMSGWQVQDVTASSSATAPAVLENVYAGDSLVVTAPATLPGKVKSVKAVKYVAPAATVATAPTATAAIIAANSTAALVNAGAANGGSMMYAVTTTNAQPASTADFSATIPTAQGRAAGTYYVWYYAKADADHSDSEIAGPVSVTLEVAAFILGGEGIFTNSRLQFTFSTAGSFDNNVWADWNGTSFTCDHGSDDWYGDQGARVSVNGAIISLGVSDDWEDEYEYEGFTVNFNTSNNTYTITKGDYGALPNDVTSVKVNGVEVKGNLTKQ